MGLLEVFLKEKKKLRINGFLRGVFFPPRKAASTWDVCVEEFNCMCSPCWSLSAHPHFLDVNAFIHIHLLEIGEQALCCANGRDWPREG